jgi:hypothetical protein
MPALQDGGSDGKLKNAQGLGPASTGWLVASILFANKLWIMDATSMSLYWVARLPIKGLKEQTSSLAPSLRINRSGHKRQWKIAVSLAVLGALAAPFVFRTYNYNPTHMALVPLTAETEERYRYLLGEPACEKSCNWIREDLLQRTAHERRFNLPEYLLLNTIVAVVSFVGVFALSSLIPMLVRGLASLGRRYWKWLNA